MYLLENLTKTYHRREEPVHALDNVSLEIEGGGFVAITGSSGSGKTTLLLTLGGLIRPTSGKVAFANRSLYDLTANRLASYRAHSIGFVLQTFNLIPYLTAIENVVVPMLLCNGSVADRSEKAAALLDKLGLARRMDFLPRELSVGQQQRVAIARALANDPEVILADEPTGNLDPGLSSEVLDILRQLNESDGKTIVMVSHDPKSGQVAGRNLKLEDGRLLDEST